MNFDSVEKLIEDVTGLDITVIGRKYIHNRIKEHMRSSGMDNTAIYAALLETSREHLEKLIEDIVVHETWFFRDAGSFDYLETYIRDIWLPAHTNGNLKILSVPCSSGEEPFSIALSVLETGISRDRIRIDAVDISKKDIETAKNAVYGKNSFRSSGIERHRKRFQQLSGGYKLDENVTSLVNFFNDNLLSPGFLANHEAYDIVFCRNLLIYLTENARVRMLSNIERLLSSGSILFTGHSEMFFFQSSGFQKVNVPGSFACIRKSPQPQTQSRAKRVRPVKSIPRKENRQAGGNLSQIRIENADKHPVKTRESDLGKARVLANRGNLEEAYDLCKHYLDTHRPDAKVYYLMGLINQSLNRLSIAEDFFLKSVYLDPCHYDSLMQLSLLYEQKGEIDRATIYRRRAQRCYEPEKA